MRDRSAVAAIAVAVSLWAAAAPSAAQTVGGIALDPLHLAPPGDTFAAVPSPFAAGHLVPRAMIAFDFAQSPFRLITPSRSQTIVGSQGLLRIGASLALWDRLLVSAEMPLALVQSGESPKAGSLAFASPGGVAAGDLRLGLRFRLAGDDGGPVQIGAGAEIYVPTSPAGSFTGEPSVRVAPQVIAGGRAGRFVWSAVVGAQFHGAKTSPATIDYGAAAGVVLGKDFVQIGPEIFASTPVQETFYDLDAQTSVARGLASNLELLLGARLRWFRSMQFGFAGGPGLTSAVGTPAFRVVGSIAWAPLSGQAQAEKDTNGDTDEDGVPDAADACPYAWGAKAADPKRNGCPVEEPP
jgi:OmpA-OmpF porin, OOP family